MDEIKDIKENILLASAIMYELTDSAEKLQDIVNSGIKDASAKERKIYGDIKKSEKYLAVLQMAVEALATEKDAGFQIVSGGHIYSVKKVR